MDPRLKDKVVLVTAASRGLGAATARRFAEEGAHVAILSRSAHGIERAAEAIAHDTGAQILPMVGDVSKPEEVDQTVQAVIDRWRRLDILVANASGPTPGQFLTLKWENWEAAGIGTG